MKKALQQRLDAINAKRVSVGTALMVMASMAMAQTEPPASMWDQFFGAIDLSGISGKVIAAGLLVIGIALAFKGPDIAKRLVRKV